MIDESYLLSTEKTPLPSTYPTLSMDPRPYLESHLHVASVHQ